MKHLEVRQKYSAARRIFNSLLGVSSGDETLHLIVDILLQTFTVLVSKDSRRVLLTACDMSSVHCLMQILTAFLFIFWCVRLCNKRNAIKRQAFLEGP